MNQMMMKFWNDDAGYILSAESVFLFTITVLGVTVGMAQVRNANVQELTEVANALSSLNQSYGFSALVGCGGSNGTYVPGSSATQVSAFGGYTVAIGTTGSTVTVDNSLICP